MPRAQANPGPRPRRAVQPQPRPPAWSADLLPSQRRASERRAAAEHQRAVQRSLRDYARRPAQPDTDPRP